jgi:teichuronic acid exporter
MNLGDSIRNGTKWLVAGSLAGQVLSFAFGVALARILAPEDFGFLVTVQIFTGIAGFVASGGTGDALVQSRTLGERDFDAVFTMQLCVCILIYIFFFFLASWVAAWFRSDYYEALMRVSSVSFLIRPFQNIPRVKLRREMRFEAIAKLGFASSIVSGVLSVALALLGFGTWALVFGGLVSGLVIIPGLFAVARWRPRLYLDRDVARRVWRYGVKVSAVELVGYCRSQVPNLILSRAFGPSEVGLFNKANSLSYMPVSTLSASVYEPIFRALATLQDSPGQSRYIYLRTVTLLTLYTLPLYVCMRWLAQPFILFVFGQKWMQSATLLQILSLSGLFFCLGHPSGAVLAARNLLGRELIVQINHLILLAVACAFGLHNGVVWISWVVFATYVYSSLHMSWLANVALGVSLYDILRALVPGVVLNAILIVVLALTEYVLPPTLASARPLLYLIVTGGVGALVYGAGFLFLPIPALSSEAARWRRTLGLR